MVVSTIKSADTISYCRTVRDLSLNHGMSVNCMVTVATVCCVVSIVITSKICYQQNSYYFSTLTTEALSFRLY